MAKREADPITIDHIIELRKEILLLERRLEQQEKYTKNTADYAMKLLNENIELKGKLNDLTRSNDSETEADYSVHGEERPSRDVLRTVVGRLRREDS